MKNFYSRCDFKEATRKELLHYLRAWGADFNKRSHTKTLRKKALSEHANNIEKPAAEAHKFLL